VLLLNYTNESASGANLTGANHAIFLSPLLTTSQAEYDAQETQAIGRLRRYGQKKHVHIWRFLSANTIDEVIYEDRTDGKKREEEAARADDDEVMIIDEDE
jgi:SNF2 family DNA or RNA helicase